MEPVIVEYNGEPATETFINIVEAGRGSGWLRSSRLLKPCNKLPGKGQLQFAKSKKSCAMRV